MPAVRTTEEVVAEINAQFQSFGSALKGNTDAMTALAGRVGGLEQALAAVQARGGGLSAPARQSWGAQVTASDPYKQFVGQMGARGTVKIPIKAELSTPSGVEQRDLVAPQRDAIQGLPQQILTVRDLINAVPTTSNLIQYVRQISRSNAAAPVADGAQKPESDLGFELAESPVRTIAHWVPCPRQTAEDIPGLSALIDNELTFGLRLAEEAQVLTGDGTGQNLKGLIPQALAYSAPFSVESENALDRILLAIVQAQQSRLPCDGVMLNDIDWAALISLKDDQGRYLSGQGGGPFGSLPGLLWQVRVLPTPSMARGECLVGAFRLAARLHDRLEPEVLVSSEDRDNFIKNMLTIRAEERVALSVRVPDAFVYIDDLAIPGATG